MKKQAGFPGSFMSSAMRDSARKQVNHFATTKNSGLSPNLNVKGPAPSMTRVPKNPFGQQKPKLLNKIAEIIVNSDKTLPYRRRVEVAIFKNGKVLLTKNKDKESGDEWYGFPGGGTEGETDESAAKKECLEEVGVEVSDLSKTEILHTTEGISAKKGRENKYRGSKTRMFTATYEGKDNSSLGEDGDSVRYVWKDKKEALELLAKNKIDPSYRIKTLKEYWRD